jgi:hypothetical protein
MFWKNSMGDLSLSDINPEAFVCDLDSSQK